MELSPWSPAQIPSQAGKRILITGANSGIGWYTAMELARAGAEVLMTARTVAKGEEAAARMRVQVPQARLHTAVLDLSDLGAIHRFVNDLREHAGGLDTLIHNAGVMAIPTRQLSVDGWEMQFATNVVGPFALTGLLLPLLLQSAAPRVVTVASIAHRRSGVLRLNDLNWEHGYKAVQAYAQTKLEDLMFAQELQRRAGHRLLSIACHPGYARTNLFHTPSPVLRTLHWLCKPFTQSAARGAEPTLYAATSPQALPGGYYGPSGIAELRGDVREAHVASHARDTAAASALFDQLERMTQVSYAWSGR